MSEGSPSTPPKAVVLLSGGLDSACVLGLAQAQGFECVALTFDYGQRHRRELEAARDVARARNVRDHRVLKLDLRAIGGSALTSDLAVPKDRDEAAMTSRGPDAIPVTYVPARNLVFLSIAAGLAEVVGARDLFIGVNAVDYSGYPDCRPEFIEAFGRAANLATKAGVEGRGLRLHTPLISWSKARIIAEGVRAGVDLGLTHSCYDPDPRGLACGHCDSCLIRARGFRDAGVADPTRYAEARG
ncbi:MAG: 7-cyano-7-deazaguanine synthase QueC [Planctomycetota bacterium]|nr:7-cyano-7-deazaguanine synthase QueC [Planctomycetota bacterium]